MPTTTAGSINRTTERHLPPPLPLPPPSPKLLHFPRIRSRRRGRTRRSKASKATPIPSYQLPNLGSLFDQEKEDIAAVERRQRVDEHEGDEQGDFYGWQLEAEMLRSECSFLRAERESAFRKLEKDRAKIEGTLACERKKIDERKDAKAVLEEEIEDIADKLEDLLISSRSVKDDEEVVDHNFNDNSNLIRHHLERLEGLSEENYKKGLQDFAESSMSIYNSSHGGGSESSRPEHKSSDVDIARRKMEQLPKAVVTKAENERALILPSTGNSSVASSASTSKRMIAFPGVSCFSSGQFYQEPKLDDIKCSGRCKMMIQRVVKQVRTETEQWSQMQEMLRQVREEMEELQTSRDFWETRAHRAEREIESLRHMLQEWKEKALSYENKANEIQLKLYELKQENQKLNAVLVANQAHMLPLGRQLKPALSCHGTRSQCIKGLQHNDVIEESMHEGSPPLSLARQLAKEKKMLQHQRKKDRDARRMARSSSMRGNRAPLMDIGNSSPLEEQSSRATLALQRLESFRTNQSFRK